MFHAAPNHNRALARLRLVTSGYLDDAKPRGAPFLPNQWTINEACAGGHRCCIIVYRYCVEEGLFPLLGALHVMSGIADRTFASKLKGVTFDRLDNLLKYMLASRHSLLKVAQLHVE